MKISKTYKALIYSMLLCFTMGILSEYKYESSPMFDIALAEFQTELLNKVNIAETTQNELNNILIHSTIDSIALYKFPSNDISYYLYDNDELIFWSDNHIDTKDLSNIESSNWEYTELSNAFCIFKSIRYNSTNIIAVINIKNNYPYENEKLKNNFTSSFSIDKTIQLKYGNKNDKYAVFDKQNEYLFSLYDSEILLYNNTWGYIAFFFYIIAILLLFYLYANSTKLLNSKKLNFKQFGIITLSLGFIISLSLYFNIPSLLYWNKLFSSFEYSSNPFLASLSHLSIATAFVLVANYLFFFHVQIEKKHFKIKTFIQQVIFVLYFILVYNIINGLVFHSSIQISILQFKDISILALWIHFLIFIWGIGLVMLFYKTHSQYKSEIKIQNTILSDLILIILLSGLYFIFSNNDTLQISISLGAFLIVFYWPLLLKKRKSIYSYSFVWVFVYTSFFIANSLYINQKKQSDKFKVLAENIYINGNTENDRMADIMLEELDIQIKNDINIKSLATHPDSLLKTNEYLNNTYLRGFWNKYDMRLNAARFNSELQKQYFDFIFKVGTKLRSTNFYSIPASNNAMSYLGIFNSTNNHGDSINLFLEFYPRKNFKSYSFPNLLMTAAPDIQSQLNIAVAKYFNNNLVYSSGNIEFPKNRTWIPLKSKEFFQLNFQNKIYYIYNHDINNQIVITELTPHPLNVYLMYFAYTLLVFYTFAWILIWLYTQKRKKSKFRLGLTTKFQYAFVILLVFSFLGIFYVSVNFIQQKYKDEQISQIQSKKGYIQKALQDMYYWSQDLTTVSSQGLNFDLQELSYTFQTDIHVYDNHGVLIGSSQPLLFNKNLISRQIAPKPYFSRNANIIQEEHIGELNFLTAYTDFYNGDFLQIGYIAIPQFFSQEEIRNEIEGFLAVIIHIYLIIIILAIILSIFIGRQLSAPLKMIENKLRKMRFGHRNEKIDYQLNDEIGQLVAQYNRTIDELEKSANLLAQSEREMAWKTMARQIAHEINNPLTPMKLTIQQLQRTKKMGDDRFDDYFEKSTITLVEQIDNLARIAGTFSNFARMPEAHFVSVDIAAKLFSVVQLFENNHEQTELKFEGDNKDIYVLADPEQLTQVFNNLIKNAIQSIPTDRKGLIIVNIHKTDQHAIIEIIDNGSGITEEVAEKLFTPNFTTKSTGMGLGLTISKNIIELSGGEISFKTRKNQGTSFIVKLALEH